MTLTNEQIAEHLAEYYRIEELGRQNEDGALRSEDYYYKPLNSHMDAMYDLVPDLLTELLHLRQENERLREAGRATLPVIEYVRTNGWDEAPLVGWNADEVKAYELLRAALSDTEKP